MDLFHNEIISFCLRKATIKLATGVVSLEDKHCVFVKPACCTRYLLM
jgi:hypothetical protein